MSNVRDAFPRITTVSTPVVCPSCATTLSIPAEYARSKMQCPVCGIYCPVPADARREPPVAAPAPGDPRLASPQAAHASPPAGGGNLLTGTDDDDGQPYTVPGDPGDPGRAIKKATPARSLKPLTKTWDIGWPLRTRVRVFAALVALNLLALFFSAILLDNFTVAPFTLLCATALLAFLVGTSDRIELNRNGKCQVRLTRTWRVAFYELKPQPLRWSDYESVAVSQSYEPHFEDWTVLLILVPYGLIPAVLWWWFVIRPERFHVILYKDHGFPETTLFRTQKEWLACQVAETVADVTGLPIKQEAEEASGGRMIGR